MVASLGKMGSAAYYLESQKSFRKPGEYYIAGEEPDGVWWNPGGLLGLEDGGTVGSVEFGRLYSGFDPRDGETALVRNAGGEKRLAGVDLTFSADKTISAVWAVAGAELKAAIEKAHHEAARHALDSVVRKHCAWTRVAPGNVIKIVPGELVGAMFQHGVSREGDPQLHTHCTIFNAVETAADKKFRALYRLGLGRWVKAAGAVYRHHLAVALRNDLGMQIEQHGRDNAFTRIVGVPEELVKEWSERRRVMAAKAEASGTKLGLNARRDAGVNRETRKTKEAGDGELRHAGWLMEAMAVFAKIRKALTGQDDVEVTTGEIDEWVEGLHGHDVALDAEEIRETTERVEQLPHAMTRNEAVFRLPDVIERTHNAAAGVFGAEATQTAVERVMRHEEVVELGGDGESAERMAGMAHTRVYSTRHHVDMERDVLAVSEALVEDPSMALQTAAVERHLGALKADGYPISAEQESAIRYAAGTASGRVAIIEGAAGSGKSTTLRPLTDMYREAGYNVIGMAVAWRMAKQLAGDCGIKPFAVDYVLHRAANDRLGGDLVLDDRTVLIVDEAGMLGVRQAHHILRLAEHYGCKIVAVGDREQQQPIEAGAGLRLMHEAAGGVRVDTIRRQRADLEDVLVHVHGQSVESARYQAGLTGPAERDRILAEYDAMPERPAFTPWQIAASEAMRDRDAAAAIEAYHERGHFHLCKGIDATLDAMVRDWEAWQEANPGRTSIMMARTNDERRALSEVVRRRRLAGREDDERVVVHVSSGHAENRRQVALEIARGDILRVGGTIHREALYNGSLVEVQDFRIVKGVNGPRVDITALDLENGRQVRFLHDESTDCYGSIRLDHGYATTLSSAQGATVDRAFLLVDEMPAATSIYPAMTRHRDGLDIYVDREPVALTVQAYRPEDEAEGPVTDEEILEQLALRWSREAQKALAHDFMGPALRRQFAHSVGRAGGGAGAWASNDNRDARERAAAGQQVLNSAAAGPQVRAAAAAGGSEGGPLASGEAGAAEPPVRQATRQASPSRQEAVPQVALPGVGEVSAMLAAQVEDVCRRYLPNGKVAGAYWTAGNVEGDAGDSLWVHLSGPQRGKWKDGATGQHGDLVDLIQAAGKLSSIGAALKEASTYLGLRTADGAEPVARREPTPEERAEAARKAAEERAAAERKAEEQDAKNKKFYRGGREIAGGGDSPAARYLAKRGLRPGDAGGLRWRDGAFVLENGEKLTFPALLAAIETHDGKLEAVHRIFVTPEGEKAPLAGSCKRNMGSPGRGGVWFGNRSAERVVLSEGIEDAMAAIGALPEGALENMAFVATASAGRLSAVELPPTCREVVLLQDNDKAGEDAWQKLRAHHEGRGLAVSRIVARGHDMNADLLEIGERGLAAVLAPLVGRVSDLAEYMALNREIGEAIAAAGVVEGWGAIPGMKELMERAAAIRGSDELDDRERQALEGALARYAKECGVTENRNEGRVAVVDAEPDPVAAEVAVDPAEQAAAPAPTPAQERYDALRRELTALVGHLEPDANWVDVPGVRPLVPQVAALLGAEGLEADESAALETVWRRIQDDSVAVIVRGGFAEDLAPDVAQQVAEGSSQQALPAEVVQQALPDAAAGSTPVEASQAEARAVPPPRTADEILIDEALERIERMRDPYTVEGARRADAREKLERSLENAGKPRGGEPEPEVVEPGAGKSRSTLEAIREEAEKNGKRNGHGNGHKNGRGNGHGVRGMSM